MSDLLFWLGQSAMAAALAVGLVMVAIATACTPPQPASTAGTGGPPSARSTPSQPAGSGSVSSVQPTSGSRSVPLPDPCSLVGSSDIRTIFGLDMSQVARPGMRECAYSGHLVAPGGGHECDCTITLRVQSSPVRSRDEVRQIISSNSPLVEVAQVGDAAFLSSTANGLCCVTVVKDGVWVDFGPVGTPLNRPLGAMAPPPQASLEAMARLISGRIP